MKEGMIFDHACWRTHIITSLLAQCLPNSMSSFGRQFMI